MCSYGFRVDSGRFLVGSGGFLQVPVGSAFHTHPLQSYLEVDCFRCFLGY